MRKILSLAVLVASNCTAEPPTGIPVSATIPVYKTGASEAHPDCRTDATYCTYDSGLDHGIVNAYKCRTEDGPAIYTKETIYNPNLYSINLTSDLWYRTKLGSDISDDAFSDICKTSFEAYKLFREETDFKRKEKNE